MYGYLGACNATGVSPDYILMVHLRQKLHLPRYPAHHLAVATDRDALDGVDPAVQVVAYLREG